MPRLNPKPLEVSDEDLKAIELHAEREGRTVEEALDAFLNHFVGNCREEMYRVEERMLGKAHRTATPEAREVVRKAYGIKLK